MKHRYKIIWSIAAILALIACSEEELTSGSNLKTLRRQYPLIWISG